MKDSGPIAQRAALDAQQPDVLSVRETGGNNRGKYVETYLKAAGTDAGDPWCAAFVFYRLIAAAKELGKTLPVDFDPRAYTPDWRNWAIKKQLWVPVATAKSDPSTVQVGDAVLFYFASLGRVGHVGMVTGLWKNDSGEIIGVRTVEGNTGPDKGADVERAGDGVYAKKRTWAQLGARGGFARLAF